MNFHYHGVASLSLLDDSLSSMLTLDDDMGLTMDLLGPPLPVKPKSQPWWHESSHQQELVVSSSVPFAEPQPLPLLSLPTPLPSPSSSSSAPLMMATPVMFPSHEAMPTPALIHIEPSLSPRAVHVPASPVVMASVVVDPVNVTTPVAAVAASVVPSGKPPSSAMTACGICYSHKVRCDGKRPCGRCVRLKRSEKCEDRIIGGPQIHTNGRRGRVPRKPSGLQDTPSEPVPALSSSPIPSPTSSKRKVAAKRSVTPPSTSNNNGRRGSTATTARGGAANRRGRGGRRGGGSRSVRSRQQSSSSSSSSSPSSDEDDSDNETTNKNKAGAKEITSAPHASSAAIHIVVADALSIVDALPSSPVSSSCMVMVSRHHSHYHTTSDDDSVDAAPLSPVSSPSSSASASSALMVVSPLSSSPVASIYDTASNVDDTDDTEPPVPSSVEFLARSASRSPARKRDRRRSPPARASSTSPALIVSPRHLSSWQESSVVRQALMAMPSWFAQHFRKHYHPDHIGYRFVTELLSFRVPRVCPYCISPSQPCASCSSPIIRRSISATFENVFFGGMWVPRETSMYTSIPFNRISTAGISLTLPPPVFGFRSSMAALREHHRANHALMTPEWAIREMALAMIASSLPLPLLSSSPFSASLSSVACDASGSNASSGATFLSDTRMSSPFSMDRMDGSSDTNNDKAPPKNFFAAAAAAASSSSSSSSSSVETLRVTPPKPLSSSSSNWLDIQRLKANSAASGRTYFEELEIMYQNSPASSSPAPDSKAGPTHGHDSGNGAAPTSANEDEKKFTPRPNACISFNTALTSMMGWSEDAMIQRFSTLGFKQDIPLASVREVQELFQKRFLSMMGEIPDGRWAMYAHVINKWQQVIKVLIWSTIQFSPSGYRTCSVFFVPLPGKPLSENANDPIWTES